MSSYSSLCAGPFSVASTKNDVEPELMSLFVQSDLDMGAVTAQQWEEMGGEEESWSASLSHVRYKCTVAGMKERLEMLGFTLEGAAAAFDIGLAYGRLKSEREIPPCQHS